MKPALGRPAPETCEYLHPEARYHIAECHEVEEHYRKALSEVAEELEYIYTHFSVCYCDSKEYREKVGLTAKKLAKQIRRTIGEEK